MKLSNPLFDLPIIMSPHKLTMVGLTLLFLSGCVVIPLPVPEPEPFSEKVTGTIVPGKTSRNDVLATLGDPHSMSAEGKLFLYAEEQLTKFIIVCLPYACDGGQFGPTHYYIISFARNGTVASTKIVTKISDYCRRDGRCLVTEDDLNLLYAPAAIEASAKKFTPISDKCTIYFMWHSVPEILKAKGGHPSAQLPLRIAIDRRKTIQYPNDIHMGLTGDRLFHRIVVPAGIHEISYPKQPAIVITRHRPFSFQCHAGDTVFVAPSAKYSSRFRVSYISDEFTLVDPEKAKRKILRSRMLGLGK